MTKKYLFRQMLLFTTMFAVSGGSTFYILMNSSSSQDPNKDIIEEEEEEEEIPLTPADKLFASLTSIKRADFDALLSFTDGNTLKGATLKADGALDLSDTNNILAVADINANVDGIVLDSKLHYITDTVYLDYNESKLSMKTSDMQSFVDIFMGMGVNIEIPQEFLNIDLSDIMKRLNEMEPEPAPNGNLIFTLDVIKPGTTIIENDEEKPATPLTVYFESDKDCNFLGLRTNDIAYKNLYLKLEANVNSINPTCEGLVQVLPGKYQDFKPALNVIETLANIFGKEQNTLDFNVRLKKLTQTQGAEGETSGEMKNYLNIGGKLSIDNMKDVSVDLNLHEFDFARDHNIKFMLNNDTLYLNYADYNKVSLKNSTITTVVEYLLNTIDQATFEALLNKLMDMTTGMDMDYILSRINSINALLSKIEIVNQDGVDIFRVTISPDNLFPPEKSLNIGDIVFDLSSNPKVNEGENSILGIHLNEIKIGTVSFDLDIKSNNTFTILTPDAADNYVEIDPAMDILPGVLDLVKQDKFRLNVDMDLVSNQPNVPALTLDGDLQVNLIKPAASENVEAQTTETTAPSNLPLEAFGGLTLIDRSAYNHNFVIDYDNEGVLRLNYNYDQKTKVGTKAFIGTDALRQTVTTVTDFVNTNEAHINELFGDLINALGNTPLGNVISKGDIGGLFACKALNVVSTTTNLIHLQVNLGLIGMDGTFDLKIGFGFEDGIQFIKIENLVFQQKDNESGALNGVTDTLSLTLSLGTPAKEGEAILTNRLSKANGGFDLNFLPILLETILNTTSYDGFKMHGELGLKIVKIINIDIPLDVRVQNNQGKVDAAFNLRELKPITVVSPDPTLTAFGAKYGRARGANVYLKGSKDLYSERVDEANKIVSFTQGTKRFEVRTTNHILAQDFFNVALDFLLRDTLGISDDLMKSINDAINSNNNTGTEAKVCYETVVKQLAYNPDTRTTFITLDLNSLTGMTTFGDLVLQIQEDTSKTERILKNISANLSIVKVIEANLNASLVEYAKMINMDDVYNFDLAHNADPLNTSIAGQPKMI